LGGFNHHEETVRDDEKKGKLKLERRGSRRRENGWRGSLVTTWGKRERIGARENE